MRTLAPFLLYIAITLSGCSKASNKSELLNSATLRLDEAHNHAAGTNAETYVIPQGQSLKVSKEGYNIPVPPQFSNSGPNSIHLIHGNDDYFRAPWDGKSSIVLVPENLKNIRGTKSFSGFKAGETYILGIGHDNFPEPEMSFSVMWVGIIKVSGTEP